MNHLFQSHMERITIEGMHGSSRILVGESLSNLESYLPHRNVFLISDQNVARLYEKAFPGYPVYVLEPGEKSKEITSLVPLFQWLLEQGADRNSFIVGIGGGVVCDVAGFVAATFMRGVKFGFVATSLLAQVDASVGGKNGVNLSGYKNIVGTFTHPDFVICDTSLLSTLPDEEFRNGMAEVIKHALISEKEKFVFLQAHQKEIGELQKDVIDHIVSRSVHIKAAIVQADEREHGPRRLLNFGHTWGHALEKVLQIPHGQAVALGMVFAAQLSVHQGFLSAAHKDEIVHLIHNYGLPVEVQADNAVIFDAMLKDKKRAQSHMHFVYLQHPGSAMVRETPVEEIRAFALDFS